MSQIEKPFVLLVDDNEATCTLVTAILQRDYRIDIASEGNEALERIKTRNYSAILLDLRMPGMDGFDVLGALQKDSPDLLKRVLVVTASLAAKDMARLKSYKVCGVVAKPFEVETLLNAVRHCEEATGDDPPLIKQFISSGMILLVADLLSQLPR
jgi:CheY-like chemotaxis protein